MIILEYFSLFLFICGTIAFFIPSIGFAFVNISIIIFSFLCWFNLRHKRKHNNQAEDKHKKNNDISIEESNSSMNYNPKFHRTKKEEDLSFDFSMKYKNEIDKLESKFYEEYRYKNGGINEELKYLYYSLQTLEGLRTFCYSKGIGGKIYFDDMWLHCHNSKNTCFPFSDSIKDRISHLEEMRECGVSLIEFISENPGFIQKNIYAEIPEFERAVIMRTLRQLVEEKTIIRNKKSGSYELFASDTFTNKEKIN